MSGMPQSANPLEPNGDASRPGSLARAVAQEITSATSLDLLLLPLMSELARQLDASIAVLHLVDQERRELFARVQHLPGVSELRCPIGEGLVGEVASQGIARTSRGQDQASPWMAVPVLANDVSGGAQRVIAVIETHRHGEAEPFDDKSLDKLTQAANEVGEILRATHLDDSSSWPTRYNTIVGQSSTMQELYKDIHQASLHLRPTLLFGPAGSGKSLIARAIHESSRERHQRWQRIQPTQLPAQLVERILFDQDGGVSAIAGNTLFIEHITALPSSCQERLAEMLLNGELDGGRLLASTRLSLVDEVAAGRFHPALANELRANTISLPSLKAIGFEDFTRLVLFWGSPTESVGRFDLHEGRDSPLRSRNLSNLRAVASAERC